MSMKQPYFAMDAFDHPPSYSRSSSDSRPSPTYSPIAGHSELVLSPTVLESGTPSSSSLAFVYRTKNLEINFGPQAWGTSSPSYGRNGIVEARVTLSGNLKNVTSVKVALCGRVMNTFTERGLVSGAAENDVLSTSTILSPSNSGHWDEVHFIQLPFPSYSSGRRTLLPPSCTTYQPGVTIEVRYCVKVTVVRKGFRRNDTLKIPVLYLPRSFANGPLLSSIPDVVIDPYGPTLDMENDHVKVIRLNAAWKKCEGHSPPVVALSLPSTLSFASYDAIPVNLSIVSPNAPAVTKLLLSAVRIQLIKRTRAWVNGGRTSTNFNSVLGVANIVHIDETRVGVSVISSELRSQRPGPQASWTVENVAELKFFIRVSVRPPESTADYVPSFEYEQPIDLTTDAFDSPEHEMVENGHAPSPAVGLLQRSPSLDRTSSALLSYHSRLQSRSSLSRHAPRAIPLKSID